jgi:integrase
LVDENPASKVYALTPVRGERILPLSVAEVDRVADECARWAQLVRFMADSGARPAAALALGWRHVDLKANTVELPGAKTNLVWRTVHLTRHRVAALEQMPRSITTRKVFHIHGASVVDVLPTRGLERRPHGL